MTDNFPSSADGLDIVTLHDKSYDARGLTVETDYGNPMLYTYEYNESGLLSGSVDGNQTTFNNSYDALNRAVLNSGGDSEYRSFYTYRPFGPYLIQ